VSSFLVVTNLICINLAFELNTQKTCQQFNISTLKKIVKKIKKNIK